MMLLLDFTTLAQQCAPQVSPVTMAAIVRTESGFNPYAIGVVHGLLARQPVNEVEAIATVHALAANGWNFSAGLAQVNRANWTAYGLTETNAFDPCRNLAVGAAILQRCFAAVRFLKAYAQRDPQTALQASLSCYTSGNFSTGYRTGYVKRVVDNARLPTQSFSQAVLPAIEPIQVVPANSADLSNSAESRSIRNPASKLPSTSSGRDVDEPDTSAVVF